MLSRRAFAKHVMSIMLANAHPGDVCAALTMLSTVEGVIGTVGDAIRLSGMFRTVE